MNKLKKVVQKKKYSSKQRKQLYEYENRLNDKSGWTDSERNNYKILILRLPLHRWKVKITLDIESGRRGVMCQPDRAEQ